MAGKITTDNNGFDLPIPEMGGMMDKLNEGKVKWDFIMKAWPSDNKDDDLFDTNSNQSSDLSDKKESNEEITGQAYRILNDTIRELDPNLKTLKMKLVTAKSDHMIKW
eukprot:CAMPEP_0114356426 /NCGR_PEP_ID=MMETSP0101-20121206/20958_1 /TAXON_ID=38822 ORGANISM="Pteridomonas danica, Strain PT" /NCGR_SAMPLE_ID=MMETSP0101 /ASSEMBLY_ACC=CAM_ASM_000211 /LENGTH=107 /DNA_ID=CAMNT_0001498863 /DNA_START=49 /DNA_END=370 /DNA_ORIENTATION=+